VQLIERAIVQEIERVTAPATVRVRGTGPVAAIAPALRIAPRGVRRAEAIEPRVVATAPRPPTAAAPVAAIAQLLPIAVVEAAAAVP
jgi:hypothetical protein